MKKKIQNIFTQCLLISAILLFGMGCALAERVVTGSPTPAPTEDTTIVVTQISAAATTVASGGRITLEFTEGQLAAIANQELQSQGDDSLQNLQIQLDDGLMQITADVNQDGMNLPLTVTLKINVDSQGKPHSEIVGGKLGPFPLPSSVLEQTTGEFDQILQAQLDASASNLFVESVSIDNGKITIIAHPD